MFLGLGRLQHVMSLSDEINMLQQAGALTHLEAIVDLLHSHVDCSLVIGAVCNVDVLTAVAESVRLRHPLNDASLFCQRYHCKPVAQNSQCRLRKRMRTVSQGHTQVQVLHMNKCIMPKSGQMHAHAV